MAKYTTAPATEAEWSGAGYPQDTGNPTLVHVYRDGKWLCSCDGEDAERITRALRMLEIIEATQGIINAAFGDELGGAD